MLIKYGNSSHLRSAQNNARKYMGIPNCLTIASTSNKNCFQYAGVPLAELKNENALPLATDFSMVSLNYF